MKQHLVHQRQVAKLAVFLRAFLLREHAQHLRCLQRGAELVYQPLPLETTMTMSKTGI